MGGKPHIAACTATPFIVRELDNPKLIAISVSCLATNWVTRFTSGNSFIKDGIGSELLALSKPVQAYWIKFLIDDVWTGIKYSDTAISKLLVNSANAQ